jgi:hypothetical protein
MLRSLVVFSIVVMCGAALDAFSIQSQPNRLSGANAQVSVKRNPADRRWQEVREMYYLQQLRPSDGVIPNMYLFFPTPLGHSSRQKTCGTSY